MSLTRIHKAPVTILAVEQIKKFLRLDGDCEDDVVQDLLDSAIEYVETHARMDFSAAVYQLKLDNFPQVAWYQYYPVMAPFPQLLTQGKNFFLPNQTISQPVYPVHTIDWIQYVDTSGDQQTLDPAEYIVDLDAARLAPRTSRVWPYAQNRLCAVTIQFQAGFENGIGVPKELLLAIRNYCVLAYDNRGGIPAADLENLNQAIVANRRTILV